MKKLLSIILSLLIVVSSFSITTLTQAATMPSCINQKSSSITTNSARVDFTINNPSCLTIKTCGMQIRKKGNSTWTTKSETVTSSYQKKSSIPAWYTIGSGKEFNYTLSAGTTYEYRGFCVYNNTTYYASTYSFTTVKTTTMPSCNGQKSSNITTNSARIDFTINNPSCLTIKTCGMQIRKKGTSAWTTKSETVTSSYQKKSSIPAWYTIGKGKEFNYSLSEGTTYEYRGFCVYNNVTYYTPVSSFTTKKTTTTNTKYSYPAISPIKIPRIYELPDDNTCHFFCVASVEAYALGMKYSYGKLNRNYSYSKDYNAYNNKYKKRGKGKGNEIDPIVKKMFDLKGEDNVDPTNILGKLPVAFTTKAYDKKNNPTIGNNEKTYKAIYNQLKNGKPVVIYASGKNGVNHATVVVGCKANKTTVTADDLIVMEIVKSWKNTPSNLTSALQTASKNGNSTSNCYMTLKAWQNSNGRKIIRYSYPKTIKK